MAYSVRTLKTLKRIIKETEDLILKNIQTEQEEALTGRFMGALEAKFEQLKSTAYVKTQIFTSKGVRSEEKDYGADLGVVLNVNFHNLSKGFLAQSKKDGGIRIFEFLGSTLVSHDKDPKLKEQIKKMLRITPDSFVFVYSENGILLTTPELTIDAKGAIPPAALV